MRILLLVSTCAALAACERPPAPAAPASKPPPVVDLLGACLDRELTALGLNPYGDAAGTMYAGGTPLFDEKSGTRRERLDVVRERRPEVAAKCAPP